jgi:hypothetical protein
MSLTTLATFDPAFSIIEMGKAEDIPALAGGMTNVE